MANHKTQELGQKAKNDFKKDFFKLMHNTVFKKTMKNMRILSDIKLVTAEARRNYLFINIHKYSNNDCMFLSCHVRVSECIYTL